MGLMKIKDCDPLDYVCVVNELNKLMEINHDRNLEALLERDASDSGLGAALLQNGRPFASSSRALTIAETNYIW